MVQISDDDFQKLIAQAMDAIPDSYAKRMNNVGIVWEDEPTPNQRQKLKLRCNETLFGLYEGVPLTQRGAGYNMVLPDKITIFKNPICNKALDLEDLASEIKHTLWHEVAHHFGLNHQRIHALEEKER